MATTLLLEGDDLEALLERARVEGGTEARIVRAEKIRHGGVLGFFAKERFEVALEVPDRPEPAAPAAPAHPDPYLYLHPYNGTAATKGSTMSEAPHHLAGGYPVAAQAPRSSTDGLLGLAERADVAERAAAPLPVAPLPVAPFSPARSAADVPSDTDDALDLALRRLLDQRDPEPAYAASPVRPSTSRPEFTALLDQLRSGTRPSAETPAYATPAAVPVASPVAAHRDPVPAAYRDAAAPPAVAGPYMQSVPAPAGPAPLERHTLGRPRGGHIAPATRDRREDPQLAADRRALRALGVPVAWTRQLRPGDRFSAVLRMLDRMPEVDIDPATRAVAVVGPASSVLLEAHRVALDLATGPAPRPVVAVPAAAGAERAAALAEARLMGDVVVAVEAAGEHQVPIAVEALQAVGAGAVLVIVSGTDSIERSQAYLDALGQVDALAVDGMAASGEPAAVLQLGLPVVRLDGIPIDRYTWTAVLCAHLGPVTGP